MRPILIAVLLLTSVSSVSAQEIFGTLRLADGVTPASGAIVVATRAIDQTVLTRTITGERGTYVLRLAPDSIELRVLRVGQRPFVLGSFRVAPDQRVERSATLPDVPVALQTMTTRVATQCRVRPEGSETVAQLFDEARKALAASQLISNDGAPVARYALFTQSRTVRGGPLGLPQQTIRTSSTTAPFRSRSPALLSTGGYVSEEADGSTIYYAPDATVLLSDRFLSEHCLRLVDGPPDEPHLIGVEFEPARRRRDIVQVRGTLFMDRSTNELQRLDFTYVGLDAALMRANPGGRVEYTRLDNGVWFAHYWEIRMPRVSVRSQSSTLSVQASGWRPRELVVEGVLVTGGNVLDITTRAGMLYSRGVSASSVGAAGISDLSGEESACADASSVGSSAGVSGVVHDRRRSAVPQAHVQAEWKQDFRLVGNGQFVWQTRTLTASADQTGTYLLCGVPKQRLVTLQGSREGRASRRVGLRVPASRAHAVVNLLVPDR